MKRQLKLNLYDLIKKNKEELLKDRSVVEKIEKRVEEKIMKQNINLIH
ncbi:FbpB family small basic protein [Niallia circulans]|uniref:FbpB family small basic protein n=1 Tax=Niallia circulans TaxID=1397 RepID=A0A553SSK8_NIACI|nr:FbpB family small basic protein [Niallia circulans]TRZ39958.1 FbpB family small basic protein [Niallia circulans]